MKTSPETKSDRRPAQALLLILDSFCDRLEAGVAVSLGNVEQILDVIGTFCERVQLDPVRSGVNGKQGEERSVWTPEMSQDLCRSYMRGMKEGLDWLRLGDRSGIPLLVENARAYALLVAPHLDDDDFRLLRFDDSDFFDDGDDLSLLDTLDVFPFPPGYQSKYSTDH